MVPVRRRRWAALAALIAACARSPSVPSAPQPVARVDTAVRDSAAVSDSLPAVAPVRGPLALNVIYPPADALVQAADSSFIFGSAGSGDARVTINGDPVPVWPNGAWLAWVPLPAESLMRFRIEARTDSSFVVLDHAVR